MAAVERLSVEAIEQNTLIAAEHLHRYNFATRLCRGLRVADVGCGTGYGCRLLAESAASVIGVDSSESAIEAARRSLDSQSGVELEVADALEFLRRELASRVDALIMFETLEHLEDPESALVELARHARQGLKLLLSIPNSKAFEEENPYHVTDYGYEEALEALQGLGETVTILYQFQAEGSLIRPRGEALLDGRLILPHYAEAEYCKHFIACVNFGELAGEQAWARMHLNIAPQHLRYVRSLERANMELWRENARLGRSRLGAADSGATALLERERVAREITESLSWRVTAPLRACSRWIRHGFPRRVARKLRSWTSRPLRSVRSRGQTHSRAESSD